MRWNYISLAFKMIFIELLRNRIVLILFFLLPVIFYLVAWFTLTSNPLMFILGSVKDKPSITVSQEDLGIIFIGLAANGLIASFLALNIMQRNRTAKKRLILCGYRSFEIMVASMMVVASSMCLIGFFVSLLGMAFIEFKHYLGTFLGFILCAWVYGGYGLLIGSVVKRELEGILFIVLLANIDIGWLQNPIYYAFAQSKTIIEWLPGFYPSQYAIASAFSDFPVKLALLESLLYGLVFVLLSLFIFHFKLRTPKPR